jgi:MSHA biogenesis protein MshL
MKKGIQSTKQLVVLIGFFLLMSCQTTPPKQTTLEHIKCDLLEGVSSDCEIEDKKGKALPMEVSRAMIPNILGPTKNVPMAVKRFDLVVEQVPARLFFQGLVKETPYNINVHPAVSGNISLQLKKVTIGEVLETVRNVYGFDYRRTGHTIEILPATLQTRAFKVTYLDLDRGGQSEIRVSAGGLKTGTNSTGTTTATGTTTTDSSGGQITNSRIATSSKTDFWQELRGTVQTIIGSGEGRKVAVSPMAGLVVVQAMPDELRKVSEFLREAQSSLNRQVILEAKILEVELNSSFQAGINWSLLSGQLRATQLGGNAAREGLKVGDDFPVLPDRLDSPIPISPGSTLFDAGKDMGTFGGVFTLAMNYKNIASFVELLSGQGKVHVLSSPRVSTLNNQKALIKVGRDQFFVTNVSTTTTTTAATSNTTPNVQFDSFFSGIALDVTPSINEFNEVTLHIHPTISAVKEETKALVVNDLPQNFPLAASTVRESDSMVRAKNGQMVIIGGLMQDQTEKLKEGIPILKDLPLIGNAFRHTVEKTKKSELVILLRPIVVDKHSWSSAMGDTEERFEKLEAE